MDRQHLQKLLELVRDGRCQVETALDRLSGTPSEDLSFACLDHHRPLRTGMPEVVYGENKSAGQVARIMARLLDAGGPALATRVSPDKAAAVREQLPALEYRESARMLAGNIRDVELSGRGSVLVVAAGTSDIPVAEEALFTARCLGNRTASMYDVGVAGLHRLLDRRRQLTEAAVLIVVAGMEGALPSVVGGLVDKPVIAVPTSVGYGTGAGGVAALLGMLNSCSPGVAVVNIDNGFGAGCLAAKINRN